ncbi:hypothetical protein Trydic_g473 [Trypoxylus dichotomus]
MPRRDATWGEGGRVRGMIRRRDQKVEHRGTHREFRESARPTSAGFEVAKREENAARRADSVGGSGVSARRWRGGIDIRCIPAGLVLLHLPLRNVLSSLRFIYHEANRLRSGQ